MANRPPVDFDIAASRFIRNTADKRGMTQGTLAQKAGIPVDTFGRYWRGQRSIQLGDFKNILNALNVTPAEAMAEIERLLGESL